LIGAEVIVKEALEGDIAIEYQGELLKWKKLPVKDQQENIKNKKNLICRTKKAKSRLSSEV
jgi:hypothetical protein